MKANAQSHATNLTLSAIKRATRGDFSAVASSDFDLNVDKPPQRNAYRPAAVMVPILHHPDGLRVILTRRAAHLKHHPGQIAFPGGKVDAVDKSVTDAAFREAEEEIGLRRSQTDFIGSLPLHRTVTGFEVQPIVASVSPEFLPLSDPGEVEEVFSVPLAHVIDPANYFIEGRVWMGKPRRYYVVPYGPYYIWGATARMLRMFADRIEQTNETND